MPKRPLHHLRLDPWGKLEADGETRTRHGSGKGPRKGGRSNFLGYHVRTNVFSERTGQALPGGQRAIGRERGKASSAWSNRVP